MMLNKILLIILLIIIYRMLIDVTCVICLGINFLVFRIRCNRFRKYFLKERYTTKSKFMTWFEIEQVNFTHRNKKIDNFHSKLLFTKKEF